MRSARTTYDGIPAPSASSAGIEPKPWAPSTRQRHAPSRTASSTVSPPISSSIETTSILLAPTAHSRSSRLVRLGAVRRVELRLDGVGERRELVVRDVLVDDDRVVLERDEVDGVAREVGFGGDDGVPLARPRDAVEPAWFHGATSRRDLRRHRHAALLGEPLVQRLLAPPEAHAPGSIRPYPPSLRR